MKRAVALIGALAAVILGGCGTAAPTQTPPQIRPVTTHFASQLYGTFTSPTVGETFTTTNGTWTNSPTSYTYQWQDCSGTCTNISGATSSTYTVQATDEGDSIDVIVTASNLGGSASQTSSQSGVVPSGDENCFSSPSACGFPSATTVGQQNCASLTTFVSGDLPSGWTMSGGEINTNGNGGTSGSPVTLSGYNIAGNFIYVGSANYVTLNDDCVTFNGSTYGGGQGGSEIIWQNGGTHLVVTNSTVGASSCSASVSSVCDSTWAENGITGGTNSTISGDVVYGVVEDLGVGSNSTVSGNYAVSNGDDPSPHSETMYESCAQNVSVTGNTLLDPFNQQAAFYGDSSGCGACTNTFTIENNLLAGGARTVTECGNETSAGTSSMTFTGNDFARCTTQATGGGFTTAPSGAPYSSTIYCGNTLPSETSESLVTAIGTSDDGHGFWPNGGGYAIDFEVNCQSSGTYAQSNVTWSGNTWDDNGANVACQ